MLAPSLRRHDRQSRLADLAVQDVNRAAATRGLRAAANMVTVYQAAAVDVALQDTAAAVAEQGDTSKPVATVNKLALLTPPLDLTRMLAKVPDQAALGRFTTSFVYDAGRTASSIDYATRSTVIGYIRVVGGTCCARCAILAGRFYRYSSGFQRHSNCRCTNEPVTKDYRPKVPSPMDLFHEGRIHDLSRADTQAINMGADISKVVNIRRKQAGLTIGSSVMERAGKPTPAGILHFASSRDDAVRLLAKHGYIT